MPFSENIYLHGLASTPLIGPKRIALLLRYFGSAKAAWEGLERDFLAAGLPAEVVENLVKTQNAADLATEKQKLAELNITLLSLNDPDFPELLKEIPVPPQLLYVRGHLPREALSLAVVGSRAASSYGKSVMANLLPSLVNSGLVVVSGLAYGIDALAHQITCQNHRPTVAVLGCGIDDATIYPKDHVLLAQQILENGGALVSEYAPLTPALPQNFVARNRIISGLCMGTLVVECGSQSGALITAQYALEQNRLVFAVPGSVFGDSSSGTNNLLKLGAIPVTTPEDVLGHFNLEKPGAAASVELPNLNATEQELMRHLSFEPRHIDLIIEASGLSAGQVGSILTFLELKGCAKNLGASQYVRTV